MGLAVTSGKSFVELPLRLIKTTLLMLEES
jgi:hypothetical protein